MLGLPGDGTWCNHCIVLPCAEPLLRGSDAQNPARVRPSCTALAQAPTGMAKLRVKSWDIRKAELQAEVGLLRAI